MALIYTYQYRLISYCQIKEHMKLIMKIRRSYFGGERIEIKRKFREYKQPKA